MPLPSSSIEEQLGRGKQPCSLLLARQPSRWLQAREKICEYRRGEVKRAAPHHALAWPLQSQCTLTEQPSASSPARTSSGAWRDARLCERNGPSCSPCRLQTWGPSCPPRRYRDVYSSRGLVLSRLSSPAIAPHTAPCAAPRARSETRRPHLRAWARRLRRTKAGQGSVRGPQSSQLPFS
jgi:hypothetical protein